MGMDIKDFLTQITSKGVHKNLFNFLPGILRAFNHHTVLSD